MSYGEVALGVECALPARFDARAKRPRSSVLWLLLGVATLAIL
jgi:hypothetical protein